MPNTELQIREISGPEKLIWDPPQWIQDNGLTDNDNNNKYEWNNAGASVLFRVFH